MPPLSNPSTSEGAMDPSLPPSPLGHRELAAIKLDRIREDLLNFSRRNPLVNTRLDGRNNRYLRVVDELPQVLYDNLTGGNPMEFVPLPPIPDPPADEQSEPFLSAFNEARFTDEQYLADVETRLAREAAGRAMRKDPERELKDRLRERLGLSKRINQFDPALHDLRRHARDNGVDPDFELPRPDKAHADGRHTDREIQTLALPEQMRRNLDKVYDDDRTAQQEAGINSLYCAFGFLEWSDPAKAGAVSTSPLLLLPVALKFDRRTQRYTAAGIAERAEPNLVLSEKLRRELKVQLPDDFDGDVERYLAAVAAAVPSQLSPKLHRYVAFGTFNSTQVAVFNDLDPASWTLEDGPALELLISSAGASGIGDFAAEYPVDGPELRELAPLLIADADSSQVSTLIDLARGESFALEGPPGSGKSQTIVNAIAAALEQGKKVLFVAQKTAALEVVRARLTERGLLDFLLTLQADRSERQAFREQVKSRIEMPGSPEPRGYGAHLETFNRHRGRLQEYLDLLATPFGGTGLTVHEVLSEAVASAADFRLAADDLPAPAGPATSPDTRSPRSSRPRPRSSRHWPTPTPNRPGGGSPPARSTGPPPTRTCAPRREPPSGSRPPLPSSACSPTAGSPSPISPTVPRATSPHEPANSKRSAQGSTPHSSPNSSAPDAVKRSGRSSPRAKSPPENGPNSPSRCANPPQPPCTACSTWVRTPPAASSSATSTSKPTRTNAAADRPGSTRARPQPSPSRCSGPTSPGSARATARTWTRPPERSKATASPISGCETPRTPQKGPGSTCRPSSTASKRSAPNATSCRRSSASTAKPTPGPPTKPRRSWSPPAPSANSAAPTAPPRSTTAAWHSSPSPSTPPARRRASNASPPGGTRPTP
nr:hypothetical protein GCM10025732_50750 [Glycomyces mayteni]